MSIQAKAGESSHCVCLHNALLVVLKRCSRAFGRRRNRPTTQPLHPARISPDLEPSFCPSSGSRASFLEHHNPSVVAVASQEGVPLLVRPGAILFPLFERGAGPLVPGLLVSTPMR
jgi:hypothetical protein